MLKKLHKFMKYLSNRDEFLRRSITKIEEYRRIEDDLSINEEADSGPFANDIPWNDSLLGRLINSTIRKAKVGANLVRIKAVNKRLKESFDDLMGISYTSSLSKEDKSRKNIVVVYAFLESLKNSVENLTDKDEEETLIEIPEIKNLTDTAIKEITDFTNKTPAEELNMDKDDLDKLVNELKEFRKFLDQFKKNEEEKESEETEETSNVSEEFYKNTITLLNSVVTLSGVIKGGIIKYDKVETKNEEPSKVTNKVEVPSNKVEEPVNVSHKFESIFYENESLPIYESKLEPSETKAINAFKKLENSYKSSAIANMIPRIQELIKKSETSDVEKKWIVSMGQQVIKNEITIGKNLLTLQKLTEEVEQIPTSYNDIPKSISLFGNVILAFKGDLGIANELVEASQSIKNFITSYDKLKELLPKLNSGKTEDISSGDVYQKKESIFLSRYYNFIKEAEENIEDGVKASTKEGDEVSEPVEMTSSQKIIDYWSKKVNIKEFVVSRIEREKIISAFEKASKVKSIIIDGLDPIIEIVKVFNRAYKIHTTQVIPTGRAGGKVSNKTFQEYTSFNGGTPDSAGAQGGPYRNNAIFDQWENAVQEIMKNTEYQKIFRQETTLKTSEGNVIKDAGKNLLRFMNDMLDGDTLYKGGKEGKGKQSEFIEKYFGANVDKDKLEIEKGEIDNNSKNADSIKTKNLDFTDLPLKFEKFDNLVGSIFAAKTSDSKKLYYFYIQNIDNGFVYLSYCSSMYFIKKYITESGNSIKLEKNKLPFGPNDNKTKDGGKDYIISAFRIKTDNLITKEGKFLLSGNYSIKKITKFDGTSNKASISKLSADEEEINLSTFYTLQLKTKQDEKEVFSRFILKNASNSITKNGGFTNLSTSNDINKTSITRK